MRPLPRRLLSTAPRRCRPASAAVIAEKLSGPGPGSIPGRHGAADVGTSRCDSPPSRRPGVAPGPGRPGARRRRRGRGGRDRDGRRFQNPGTWPRNLSLLVHSNGTDRLRQTAAVIPAGRCGSRSARPGARRLRRLLLGGTGTGPRPALDGAAGALGAARRAPRPPRPAAHAAADRVVAAPVVAFAASAARRKFFETLEGLGARLVAYRRFPEPPPLPAGRGDATGRSRRPRRGGRRHHRQGLGPPAEAGQAHGPASCPSPSPAGRRGGGRGAGWPLSRKPGRPAPRNGPPRPQPARPPPPLDAARSSEGRDGRCGSVSHCRRGPNGPTPSSLDPGEEVMDRSACLRPRLRGRPRSAGPPPFDRAVGAVCSDAVLGPFLPLRTLWTAKD